MSAATVSARAATGLDHFLLQAAGSTFVAPVFEHGLVAIPEVEPVPRARW